MQREDGLDKVTNDEWSIFLQRMAVYVIIVCLESTKFNDTYVHWKDVEKKTETHKKQ